jgi:hypothetical protein
MITSDQPTFLMAIVPDARSWLFSQCAVILFFVPLFGTIIGIATPGKLLSSLRERSHGWIRVFHAPDTIRLPFSPQSLESVAFSLLSQTGPSDVEILTSRIPVIVIISPISSRTPDIGGLTASKDVFSNMIAQSSGTDPLNCRSNESGQFELDTKSEQSRWSAR